MNSQAVMLAIVELVEALIVKDKPGSDSSDSLRVIVAKEVLVAVLDEKETSGE